jgi:hypothetical protein
LVTGRKRALVATLIATLVIGAVIAFVFRWQIVINRATENRLGRPTGRIFERVSEPVAVTRISERKVTTRARR